MKQNRLTRRRFIAAIIVLSAAAGTTTGPNLFSLGRTWAKSKDPVDESTLRAMVKMARLLFPHEALSDKVYAEVLDQALSDVASGSVFAKQLEEASAALDDVSGGFWQDLDAAAQVKAMQNIETAPYFGTILAAVSGNLYSHPDTWKMLGYGGPSFKFGGYVDHGSGDIDWLPGAES